jgi:hypothetical protein
MSEQKYDEKAFAEALNENMADAPYDTATYLIAQALRGAMSYKEHLSAWEVRVLTQIEMFLDIVDHNQYARIMIRSGEEANE